MYVIVFVRNCGFRFRVLVWWFVFIEGSSCALGSRDFVRWVSFCSSPNLMCVVICQVLPLPYFVDHSRMRWCIEMIDELWVPWLASKALKPMQTAWLCLCLQPCLSVLVPEVRSERRCRRSLFMLMKLVVNVRITWSRSKRENQKRMGWRSGTYISIALKVKAVRASQSASQKAHETEESDS